LHEEKLSDGHEEAKAEVSGMAEKDGAFHWLRKHEAHDIAALKGEVASGNRGLVN